MERKEVDARGASALASTWSLGASNKEVARDLDLSPSTVRTHVESVFRKLECSTRAAAALKASSMGLLPSEPTDFVSKVISYRSGNSI
ncbi:response regulator transcription factor [Bradyrhizobium sp. USDA 4011]